MLIKTLVFKNPFDIRYSNPIKLDDLNRINVLIGKNDSGKTTILNHLSTYLDRLNENNGALSNLSIELSIKELAKIVKDILIAPPQSRGLHKVHSTYDEDKLKLFEEFKLFLNILENSSETDNNIEVFFYRNLEEKRILNVEYKVDESIKKPIIVSFIEKLSELERNSVLNVSNIFDYIIKKYKKMYICATRCLESGGRFTEKPVPNVNLTIEKLFGNRIFSNTLIDDESGQFKSEIFEIPNLTLILEYIAKGEIAQKYQQKLNKPFLDDFKKNLNMFFPEYEHSTYLRINPFEVGQRILDNKFDIGGWKGLGHGHQELISLLFLFSLPDNFIYLIDEPDIGLHPELQIKLLQFVNEIVSNKSYDKLFFFATHSPCFIDFNLNCSHYLCQKDSTKFEAKRIDKSSLSIIRNELGFTPGSLFQATGIIWVEGPSEYSYVRLLFECFDFNIDNYGVLIEPYFGVGNITARKLTPYNLKEINSNFLIIMDSDKKGEKQMPNCGKLNVKKEFEENNVFFWLIESFYDIEGFLPQSFLNEHFQIQIQADNSHIKKPYIKLQKYVKDLKDSKLIPLSAPTYEKDRDAPEFRSIILNNPKFKNEMAQNQELKKEVAEMIEIIKNWAKIPIEEIINDSEKNLETINDKNLNSFNTPEEIAEKMIDLLDITPNDLILDSCVGSGSFIKKLLEKGIPNQNIYAFDIEPSVEANIRKFNVNFEIKDALLDFNNDLISKFDKIIIDPPIGKQYSDKKDQIIKLYKDFFGGRLESLFIINGIKSLKIKGKIAIITHDNILFHKKYEKLREYILKNCTIQKIYHLSYNPYDFTEIIYQPVILLLQKKPGKNYEEERLNNLIEYIPYIKNDFTLFNLTSIQGIIQETYYNTAYYRFLSKEYLIKKKDLKMIKQLLNTYKNLKNEEEKKKIIDKLSQYKKDVALYLIDAIEFRQKDKADLLRQIAPHLEKYLFYVNFRNIVDNVEDFKLR